VKENNAKAKLWMVSSKKKKNEKGEKREENEKAN
jgi:hypothetical protein